MVGIGGGIPSTSNDIRLGDTVISYSTGTCGGVLQHDMGKQNGRLFQIQHKHPSHAATCDGCLAEWEEKREKRDNNEPQLHYGIIASGNVVTKHGEMREQLSKETGLMQDFPCIIIRGICDYADSHRNKQWQGYAALAAASYTKELLSYVPHGRVSPEKLVTEICK
ncbi:nucleoside phosphorylase domain-containing protein [Aspergillus spectabilis]